MEDLNAGVADAAGIEGNMNILVTGVEGYIGSVLAPYLVQRVNQLFELFERIRLTPEIFEFRAYTRLK
jgi:hypothetical protein